MTETEVAAYKEAVFGNGQSSTQSPTPPPTNDTPSAEPKPTAAIVEPSTVVPTPTTATPSNPEDEIVDAEPYIQSQIKENLGVESWEDAKAALSELAQLKLAAQTPAEVKYANEQSKQLHEAILAGENEKVYEILDTQKKIAAVNEMKPADAIKLHIGLTNKDYKALDVQDVFEEKYTYPEKPEQGIEELDAAFASREEKYKVAVEKIDRRIERDAATAKQELAKLSAELKLPEIPKPVVTENANQNSQAEIQAEYEKAQREATAAYSKMTPKDIQMVFKFNDEASKLAFDILYEPEKESFEQSVALASNVQSFFENYLDKDGNPKREEFLRDIYAGRNIQKIVSEAIVQAVNQERIRALKFQKNIGDQTQRNYVVPPMSEVEKIRQQVFGKTG